MPAHQDMTIPLTLDRCYHIFNRGINRQAIFFENGNYDYFLKKYTMYMRGYWQTYAWVLMYNHFHLVIKVDGIEQIMKQATKDFVRVDKNFLKKHDVLIRGVSQESKASDTDLTSFQNLLNLAKQNSPTLLQQLITWTVSERFRRFLLSYAKAINKQQKRTGSLFQKPFRRKMLVARRALRQTICYVHHNPIHHDQVIAYDQYSWSSYIEYIENHAENQLIADQVYGSISNMMQYHQEYKNWKREMSYWQTLKMESL